MKDSPIKQRGTKTLWLGAALSILTERGVDAVKVMPLAQKLGLTRTGFYWHFKSRKALLEDIVTHWEKKNTGNLEARCAAYAETIAEAVLNLFDCWIDSALFDSRLDLAIRNWARNDKALQARLDIADANRTTAIKAMFQRFGFSEPQAEVRAMTIIYTQIGYISMQVSEDLGTRISRMPDYVEVYTDQKPTVSEVKRFKMRHNAGKKPGQSKN